MAGLIMKSSIGDDMVRRALENAMPRVEEPATFTLEQALELLRLLLQGKQEEIDRLRKLLRAYVDHHCHGGLIPTDEENRRAQEELER